MIEIRLTKGKVAIVDDHDGHLSQWRWHAHYDPKRRGHYARNSFYVPGNPHRQVSILLHHAVMGMPSNRSLMIDHINGNSLDNRRINLRVVTARQNQGNQIRKKMGETSSRFVGVCRFHRGGWKAQLKIAGKQRHLGVYATEREAADAYQRAVIELNGGKKL